MKHVGVRDFRDHASEYVASPEPVAIERHGHLLGFFVPVRRDRHKARAAMDRLGMALEAALSAAGISEVELEGLALADGADGELDPGRRR